MQLQVNRWRTTLLIIKQTVEKQVIFEELRSFSANTVFLGAVTSRITLFLIEFDKVPPIIPGGIQKYVVLWVFEQHFKGY